MFLGQLWKLLFPADLFSRLTQSIVFEIGHWLALIEKWYKYISWVFVYFSLKCLLRMLDMVRAALQGKHAFCVFQTLTLFDFIFYCFNFLTWSLNRRLSSLDGYTDNISGISAQTYWLLLVSYYLSHYSVLQNYT